ncbi:MAG: hypothetical protein Roseis2KO_07370 [Roseivirga sp.]
MIALMAIFLTPSYGQIQSDKLIKMTDQERAKVNHENIVKAYLLACAQANDLNNEACKNMIYFNSKAKTLAEVYMTVLKGDQSLKEAGFNDFKKKKAQQAIASRAEEIKKTILGVENSFVAYGSNLVSSRAYDFEKEQFKFSPMPQTKGSSGIGLSIGLTEGSYNEELFEVHIPLPMSKAEKLFDNRGGQFDVIWVVFFKDPKGVKYQGTKATIQSIKVFEKKTGAVISELKY